MPVEALMALDVGEKRIGVARATTDVKLAMPFTTLEHTGDILDDIEELMQEGNIAILVIGLPRGMQGQETAQTATVRQFAKQLEARLSAPVHLQDEAVTSIKARETLEARGKPFDKKDVDALAASFILQDFIDTHPELLH